MEEPKLEPTEELEEKDEYFQILNGNREGGEGLSKEEEVQDNYHTSFNSSVKFPPNLQPTSDPIPRYTFPTEGNNYNPLYPAGSTSMPSYAVSQPFPSSTSGVPYLPRGSYAPIYRGLEYPPTEQPRAEFSYTNYGNEYARPPGMGSYPIARPANTYQYPYAQPDSMYGYMSQPQGNSMGNYYMPPRNNNWPIPSYEQDSQYYPGASSNFRNMPRYQPVSSGMEYRPRAVSAPHSAFLENFRQKLTYAKKIEIEDLKGHMLELSKDQFGSRHLQQRIQEDNQEEKEIIHNELKPYLNELMTDAFGNYVVQMFVQYSSQKQRDELIASIIKNTKKLSFDMYGCRCIQKALAVGSQEQRLAIVNELKDNVAECVESQHANHVLQKCIECLDTKEIGFLLSYSKENVVKMSCNMHGCKIMQKIVEKANLPEAEAIIEEITKKTVELAQNQFGNYVVQHVIEHGKPQYKEKIVLQLKDHLLFLSKQKFSSNVIERCFLFADEKSREVLIRAMLGKEGDL